jgi:hypothetical protein
MMGFRHFGFRLLRFRYLGLRFLAAFVSALIVAFAVSAATSPAKAQYWEGACGGAMRGYDGREYPCQQDRKPVCDQSSGRCVCLERRDCGGRHDQGWYQDQ